MKGILSTVVIVLTLAIATPAYSETPYQMAVRADMRSLEQEGADVYRKAQAADNEGLLDILTRRYEAINARHDRLHDEYNKTLSGGPYSQDGK